MYTLYAYYVVNSDSLCHSRNVMFRTIYDMRVWCSVLQCVAVCCSAAMRCSVLQCAAVCCTSVLQRDEVCRSVLQCAALCCSVLQRVAACCSAF